MVAYTSIETTGPRTYPVSSVGLDGRQAHHARGQFTAATALTTADTVLMCYLPARARIVSAWVKSTGQLDSNGTPTVTVNVGTVATPTLLFNASTAVGRVVGDSADTAMNPTGRDFVTTAKTPIYMTLGTAPATGATTNTMVLVITFIVENPA